MGDGEEHAWDGVATDLSKGNGRVHAPRWVAYELTGLERTPVPVAVAARQDEHVLGANVSMGRVAPARRHANQHGLGVRARLRRIRWGQVHPLDAFIARGAPRESVEIRPL